MDKAIIKNWNKIVTKNDKVFVAGDVSFYNKEKTTEIINQLYGKKILIKGNHDQRNNQWWVDCGFAEVSNYPIIYNEWLIIRHEHPTYYNDSMPFFWIYAHVHNTPLYKTVTTNTACVSVERWNYTPVEIEKILELSKLV